MRQPQAISIERQLFLFACLACGVPVWLPQFPPMVDLPQHAAQVALLLNLDKPGFPFSDLFHFNLFTPYLFGYGLIAILMPMLGIVAACKLIIWLALAAFAASTRFLLREAGADPYWAWLAFPVLYGFTYQWGLLVFLIAIPLGLLFLGWMWRMRGRTDWRASVLIVLMLVVLFFSHALVLGFFSLIAVGYWMLSARSVRDFIKCAWPMAVVFPLPLIWFAHAGANPLSGFPVGWDLSWFRSADDYYFRIAAWANHQHPGWGRINGFIPRLLGVRPGLAATATGIFMLALPFLSGARIDRSPVRWMPAIAITLLLLLLPTFLFGNMYTFQRFTFLFMPLYLLMFDVPAAASHVQRGLRMLAPLLAFGWMGFMSMHALQFDRDAQGFDDVLARMEPGKRVLSMDFTRDDSHSIAPTFLHFPSWYAALKSGVTDPSFAGTYVQPVSYRPERMPTARFEGFEWNPQWFDWQKFDGDAYDYFVVRAPVNMAPFLFKTAPCLVDTVTRSGQWWLYRKDAQCRSAIPAEKP